MNADLPAGGESTNPGSTERVACTNAILATVYEFARRAESKDFISAEHSIATAKDLFEHLEEALQREKTEATRQGQPGSKAVHGEAARDAEAAVARAPRGGAK